jgi:hypothetical protein
VALQEAGKMSRHCPVIVGDQDSAGPGGLDEHRGIRHADLASKLSALEIDRRLPTPDTTNDLLLKSASA